MHLGDEQLDTCIRRPLYDHPQWFNDVFTTYNMYKNGFLPNEGSYLAQPLGFLQLINIMDSVLAECDIMKQDKEDTTEAHKKRAAKMGSK